MKFKFEEDSHNSGTFWLCLAYPDTEATTDIASELWRAQRESSKQYLPERNFIDPFDPTEQELTIFELLYGTESKDEYLKWMKAVIEFRKQQENVDETNNN